MSRLAQLSSFGAWSPFGVVSHIRACSDVFSLVIASWSASFRSLNLSTHFRTYYPCHPGIGNLPFSWHCFNRLVTRWFSESQEDARYY